MSKKEPVRIEFKPRTLDADFVYESKVVASGNGATIKSFKRFIGKNATIIIGDEKMNKNAPKPGTKAYEKLGKFLEEKSEGYPKTNV